MQVNIRFFDDLQMLSIFIVLAHITTLIFLNSNRCFTNGALVRCDRVFIINSHFITMALQRKIV